MLPRVLFLLVPNRGRRRTNGRDGESRNPECENATLSDLSYSWRESDIRARSLRGFDGKRWIPKLHESSFAFHLSVSLDFEKLHSSFTFRNMLLRNSSSLMITYICTGIAEHPSHGHTKDHRLFITAVVQLNCLQIPQSSDNMSRENLTIVARCCEEQEFV